MKNRVSRRSILKAAGTAGVAGGLPEIAMAFQPAGPVAYEVAASSYQEPSPKFSIKFAVIGIDHNHINGITDALRRGGGQLVAVHSNLPATLAEFQKRYPGVKVAASEDEILNDPSIQLVASAAIPDLRAPLGIRVMRHGKDYLSDKPGIISLERLAEVRQVVKETGRMFAIMYSERLEVRAAVHAGALVGCP
jgi:predicted dehydrogenase